MKRAGLASRTLWLGAALVSAGCGKFQQARECGSFVKTVNAWLVDPEFKKQAEASPRDDPKRVAEGARRSAEHYDTLSKTLAALHVQSEELAPRAKRYEAIADSAARALREVADALDRGNLEQARQKRIDFDSVAKSEPLLVREINDVCR